MARGRVIGLQAQQVEVGRIRLGTTETKTSRQGREYQSPVKLERFRLTSRSQQLIIEAAGLYGGEPEPWQPQSGGAQQWQVIIDKTSIPVIVPPDPCSQFFEIWQNGRCQRRCDGQTELLSNEPCLCVARNADPAARQCKPTTRLSLMLSEMRGIGVWRLESHGYNAAMELPAVADLLSAAGGNVPARLEMEERSATVPDPRNPDKEVISRFMVPVLHVEATPAAIVQMFSGGGAAAVGAAPAAAIGAAPAAIAAAPQEAADEPPDEENKRQWTIHAALEEAISRASTREHMLAIREEIQKSNLDETFLGNITYIWNERAKKLAAGQPAARTPSAPPAASTPPPGGSTSAGTASPTTTADRTAVWQNIVNWAGTQQMSLSQIKARFKAWGRAGDEISRADAEQLSVFYAWLRG